jgi:hypothetical protein
MWIPNVLHFSSGFAGNRLKIIGQMEISIATDFFVKKARNAGLCAGRKGDDLIILFQNPAEHRCPVCAAGFVLSGGQLL